MMQLSLDTIRKVIDSEDTHISEEEFDENFNAITTHIERGEYEEAIPLIESSFETNTCDIRLAMYFMYLYIHYGGIKNLHEVLPFLNVLMTSHWEKLSPLPRRDKHSQKSLKWFFSRLIKAFEKINHSYKHKDHTPLETMTAGVTEEMLPAIQKDSLALNETLSGKWDNPSLGNHLLNVQKWATDLSQTSFILNPQKRQPKKDTPCKNGKTNATQHDKASSIDEEPNEKEVDDVAEKNITYTYTIPLDDLEPSQEMECLYKKLQAFQLLAEQGDYKKAAIIAEDIDKRIENFDPLSYFPKIFIKYYSLYAKHASKIGEGQVQANPHLQKLYTTDLESFIEW